MFDHDTLNLTLVGEVDLAASDEFRDVMRAFQRSCARHVAVDLKSVTFMDSTGLRLLLDLRTAALPRGGNVILRSPSQPVARVLQISGLTEVFVVED